MDEVIVAQRWFRPEEVKAVYNRGINGQPALSVTVPDGPEITVEQPVGTSLTDAVSTVNFGARPVGTSADLTFTVRNIRNMNLTGLGITIGGTNPSDFSVIASPTAPVLPGGVTTFTVRFTPGAEGPRSAGLHVASNDADENPFDIGLSGAGSIALQVVRSLTVNEGGTNILSVRLSTLPTGNVTVATAFNSGDSDLSVGAGGSLIFTPANWNIGQNVTFTAAEDDDGLNGQAVFQISTNNYAAASVTVVEADNDISVPVVLAGAVSGNYDFSGRDVVIHDLTLDPFDGRGTPADHSIESPGVAGDGNSSGSFRVRARSIIVDGTIDASAKGFGGGGGGAATGHFGIGAGGGGSVGVGLETSGTAGFRGAGGSGNGGAGGKGGGIGGVSGGPGSTGSPGGTVAYPGGTGGTGSGLFPGSGGVGIGANGVRGGYAFSETNGDSSIGFELFRGSGGGGGGGGIAGTSLSSPYATLGGNGGASGGAGAAGFPTYAGGGGGGGGGAGGGMIILDATNEIRINLTGKLFADGGGRASLAGGYGAGGGIGMRAPSVIVASGVIVRNLGGFGDGIGNTVNGGTIKLVYGTLAGSVDPNLSGRVHNTSLTAIQQWKLMNLGDSNASELGDIDGDGLAILAEYALNHSPTLPSTPPVVEGYLYAEGKRLRVFFTRDPARNDVTIEVQAASNLAGAWTTIATSTLGSVTTGPGYVNGDSAGPGVKTVEVRDTVNIVGAAQRFLRFRITH